MHRSISMLALVAALPAAACAPDLASSALPLTTDDVDVAPECQGLLAYTTDAGVDALDASLPRAVAEAIAARRAQAPLATLADLLAVPGVGPARAAVLLGAARAAGYVDDTCAGIVETIALSIDDVDALVAFSNGATLDALRAEVPASVASAVIARRPFASPAEVAAVPGVGPTAFRALRNGAVAAAAGGDFEQLADAINAAGRDVTVRTRFGVDEAIGDERENGRLTSAICFGLGEDQVPAGATIRPELATGAEVLDAVTGHVRWANRSGGLDTAPGLADLAARTDGRTFAGCYLRFEPDPWSGINRQFFVDTASTFRVFSELRWSE